MPTSHYQTATASCATGINALENPRVALARHFPTVLKTNPPPAEHHLRSLWPTHYVVVAEARRPARGGRTRTAALDPIGSHHRSEVLVCVFCGLRAVGSVSLTPPRCRSVRLEYAKRRVFWAHIMGGSDLEPPFTPRRCGMRARLRACPAFARTRVDYFHGFGRGINGDGVRSDPLTPIQSGYGLDLPGRYWTVGFPHRACSAFRWASSANLVASSFTTEAWAGSVRPGADQRRADLP